MVETSEEKYHSNQEVMDALSRLTNSDLLRLQAIANTMAWAVPGHTGEDLLGIAIERTLAGTRRWPKKLDLVPFLRGVIRSLVDQCLKHAERVKQKEITPGECGNPEDLELLISNTQGEIDNPLSLLSGEELLNYIIDKFRDDELGGEVLLWRSEGYTPDEIMKDLGLSKTEYETISTRIRRRIAWIKGW